MYGCLVSRADLGVRGAETLARRLDLGAKRAAHAR
jgi:hypothetical protein